MIVFGDTSPTDDHVRIGVKCLSPDKTFRYKVDMKLMDKSTKQSKINSGTNIAITELSVKKAVVHTKYVGIYEDFAQSICKRFKVF